VSHDPQSHVNLAFCVATGHLPTTSLLASCVDH
jgi:hypothetical protein